MAYKAYRPYKPDFRTVTKTRGRTAEPKSIAQRPPELDPMKSIYTKDYSKGQGRDQKAGGGNQAQAFNPYNVPVNRNLRE